MDYVGGGLFGGPRRMREPSWSSTSTRSQPSCRLRSTRLAPHRPSMSWRPRCWMAHRTAWLPSAPWLLQSSPGWQPPAGCWCTVRRGISKPGGRRNRARLHTGHRPRDGIRNRRSTQTCGGPTPRTESAGRPLRQRPPTQPRVAPRHPHAGPTRRSTAISMTCSERRPQVLYAVSTTTPCRRLYLTRCRERVLVAIAPPSTKIRNPAGSKRWVSITPMGPVGRSRTAHVDGELRRSRSGHHPGWIG